MCFLVTAFTIGVFSYAPLNIRTLGSQIDYSLDNAASPGGIAWHPYFTELDVMVSNPTDGNYDNVDVLIRPDYPVAAVAQASNLGDFSFEDDYGVINRVTAEEVGTSAPPTIMGLVATDAGFKVHCGRIPPNRTLIIVMAVVDIKKASGAPIRSIADFTPDNVHAQEIISGKDGNFNYWLASSKNSYLYGDKPKPRDILVSGSYVVGNCKRSITKHVGVWWGDANAR